MKLIIAPGRGTRALDSLGWDSGRQPWVPDWVAHADAAADPLRLDASDTRSWPTVVLEHRFDTQAEVRQHRRSHPLAVVKYTRRVAGCGQIQDLDFA
jgi:hypothetical protein